MTQKLRQFLQINGDVNMDPMVIEVDGIPDVLPYEQMVDQLKMHFLRRSNHGDDVLMALYPTSIRGQAYIVFESADAFGVLEHPHVLKLEDRCFPLRVKRAVLSQIDMNAEATLNINKFQRQTEVLQLFDLYGFEVTKLSHDQFLLKGSFLKLKLLRTRLIQLLVQDLQPDNRSNSALLKDYSSGHVSKTVLHSLEPRDVPKSTYKFVSAGIGNGTEAKSWNSSAGASPTSLLIPKPTSTQPSNPKAPIPKPACVPYSSSTLYGNSGSGTSPRSLSSSCDDSLAISPSSSSLRSSYRQEEFGYLVDTDILTYALTHKQDSVNHIKRINSTEMSFKDDAGLTMVMFWGKNREKAAARFLDMIQHLTSCLRIQEIDLAKYDHERQTQIWKRIQQCEDLNWDVVIMKDGDIIKVVGSSVRSFEMKQMLLGQDDERGLRGRNMERSTVLRRSSSLPRQYRLSGLRDTEEGGSHAYELQSSVTKGHSSFQYQEEPQRGAMLNSLRGSQHSRIKQTNRNRSSSEVRSKNSVTRDQLQQQDKVLPSGGETKSRKPDMPELIKQLAKGSSNTFRDIKQKLHKNNNK